MSDISIPTNAGDFRIFSKRVVDELKKFKEKEAFLRGMVSYVGFSQGKIFLIEKKDHMVLVSIINLQVR